MEVGEIIELLGWITVISFGISISNFFVKYISRLRQENKQIVNAHRTVMKLVIKNHKLAGTIAVFSVLTHFFIAFLYNHISITGIISALLMISIFFLGVYGAFMRKGHRGIWLKIHRILVFTLIISIAIHIL